MRPQIEKRYLINYFGYGSEDSYSGEGTCKGESEIDPDNYLFELPDGKMGEFTEEDVVREIIPQ